MIRTIAALSLLVAGATHAASPNVVISQVYGGGGNTNATYRNDFIELFNRGTTAVNLSGMSVQYTSATGSGTFGSQPITALSGMLQPGQHYLIMASSNAAVGDPLPTPDATTTTLLMAAGAGKVVLVNTTAGLACNSASNCSATQLAQIIDLVGYGNANFFEGTGGGAPTISSSLADFRGNGGCTDTDSNSADFTALTPAPRNSASPLTPCGGGNAPIIPDCPATLAATVGSPAIANIKASDADGFVQTAAITSTPVAGITVGNVVPGSTLTANLQVADTVAAGNYPTTITFTNTDPTPQTATCNVAVNVAPPTGAARIHDVQGAAHISPLNGQTVQVPGIVTFVRSNGFFLQDPTADSNPATSEGIFVFTNSAPTVQVGDSVQVRGTVQEFRPGGSDGLSNLTITELSGTITVTLVSSGNPLPDPVVLGIGGRAIPTSVIEDDASSGDVETSGTFDPDSDAIDFYESLEGMRVRVNNAVATGPTSSVGEIEILADNGVGSGLRTARGGILISATDSNPERMFIDDALMPVPAVNVGDGFAQVNAIVDYSFGNFKLDITSPLTRIDHGLQAETTNLVGSASRVTVGSYNVENLAPGNPPAKFAALASQIVNNLHAPDIVALMELQDNNGTTSDGTVDATTTFSMLIAAIQTAGGPAYQVRSINPVDGQDGGQPGGNIRVGFLFNPARVSFVDRAGGTPTSAVSVVSGPNGPQLTFSPGRIDPANTAWANSRKPLVGEFTFNGRKLFVIANHFNSKIGDDPLFGHAQPPVRTTEVQRHSQATVVNAFVKSILSLDPNASVAVLGDLNDFEFSDTVTILKSGNALTDLADSLPANERYGYVFDGNSQTLDHILVSPALANFANPELDIVHANAEFSPQTSDHDPDVARLTLPKAGDADGDGDVDRADIDIITAARNTNASGPYDPRNLNSDTRIDALDARLAVNACTRPGCAVQ